MEKVIKREGVRRVNEDLVRTQYVIMNILRVKGAINHMRSITIAEIAEQEKRNKLNTLYKHIRDLQAKGFVKLGAKVERANGYYLSESGVALLKKYMEEI